VVMGIIPGFDIGSPAVGAAIPKLTTPTGSAANGGRVRPFAAAISAPGRAMGGHHMLSSVTD